jgi:hypothetical protein
MGHSAGLRAGTRVCFVDLNCFICGQVKLTLPILVCVLARLQEEGYDPTVYLLKSIPVRNGYHIL